MHMALSSDEVTGMECRMFSMKEEADVVLTGAV